jgi:hypothetical protein
LDLPDFDHAGLPTIYEYVPFTATDICAFPFDMSIALSCAQNMQFKAAADKICIAIKRDK